MKGSTLNKRKKIAELRKLEKRVDELHEMFRPKVDELDLKMGDDIAISTAIYHAASEIRSALQQARTNLEILDT